MGTIATGGTKALSLREADKAQHLMSAFWFFQESQHFPEQRSPASTSSSNNRPNKRPLSVQMFQAEPRSPLRKLRYWHTNQQQCLMPRNSVFNPDQLKASQQNWWPHAEGPRETKLATCWTFVQAVIQSCIPFIYSLQITNQRLV